MRFMSGVRTWDERVPVMRPRHHRARIAGEPDHMARIVVFTSPP